MLYLSSNLFWAYLRDDKKVIPFVWSNDRSKVKNIESKYVYSHTKEQGVFILKGFAERHHCYTQCYYIAFISNAG